MHRDPFGLTVSISLMMGTFVIAGVALAMLAGEHWTTATLAGLVITSWAWIAWSNRQRQSARRFDVAKRCAKRGIPRSAIPDHVQH